MTVFYEFVVETLDWYEGCGDDPDIIDTIGFDRLDLAYDFAKICADPWRICLRRDEGSELEGLTDRFYSYAGDDGKLGALESYMGANDGPDLPKRFREIVIPLDGRG